MLGFLYGHSQVMNADFGVNRDSPAAQIFDFLYPFLRANMHNVQRTLGMISDHASAVNSLGFRPTGPRLSPRGEIVAPSPLQSATRLPSL